MTNIDGQDPAQDQGQEIGSLSFEEAFGRLSEMSASLEDGGLTLSEATGRYEEGMRLVQRCNQLLDEAQLKITELKDSYASFETDQELAEEV